MRQDIRLAFRLIGKNPGFATAAILTLALGIGANTAIFSVVNTVMLRPLPFAEPGSLVRIWESNLERGFPTFAASHPNFLDFRAQQHSLQAMAASTNVAVHTKMSWTPWPPMTAIAGSSAAAATGSNASRRPTASTTEA